MAIDPRELDGLLGAYALDAVDSDERRVVEQYLLSNPRARAEVEEHREVASMLAWSGASAPEGLWDRIASSLDDQAPAPGPELAKVMPQRSGSATVVPIGSGRRRWARRAGAWVAASAAAAAIAVVAVRAIDGSDDGMQDPIAAAADRAMADRDSQIATLAAEGVDISATAVVDQDGHGFVMADDLPTLADDRTYQLWGVMGDEVISLGVLGANPETEMFSAEGGLTALVITNEVVGGVPTNGNPDGAYAGDLT